MKTFIWEMQRNGALLDFFFTRVNIESEIYYCITVVDEVKKFRIIHMEMQNGCWRIAVSNCLPQWIIEMEDALGAVILENNIYRK